MDGKKNGKTLKLRLTFQYWDEIVNGGRKIETRDATDYWAKRLVGKDFDFVEFQRAYTPEKATFEFRGLHRLTAHVDHKNRQNVFTEHPLEEPVPESFFAVHLGNRVG